MRRCCMASICPCRSAAELRNPVYWGIGLKAVCDPERKGAGLHDSYLAQLQRAFSI